MYPKVIQKLINLFSNFPTIGPRTATRFVFYLLKLPKEKLEELSQVILDLKKEIKICKICFNPFSPAQILESKIEADKDKEKKEICPICQNPARDRSKICVIANETDLAKIESTRKYNGVYHILGGNIKLAKKNLAGFLKIKELIKRIEQERNKEKEMEIILALNPTTEGNATSLYLEKELKPFNIKITRLGRGLPIGGELEYADEETLSSSLEGRN